MTGIGVAAISYFQFERSNPTLQRKVFSTALVAVFLNAILTVTPLILMSRSLSNVLFNDPNYSSAVILISLLVPIELLYQLVLTTYQAQLNSFKYLIVCAIRTTACVLITSVLVLYLNLGFFGILISMLSHTALATLPFVFLILRNAQWSIDIVVWWNLLKFGAPFVPGGIFLFILNSADRYFLSRLCGPSSVGIYSLGYKLGSVLPLLLLGPFMKVWSAIMIDTVNSKNGRRTIALSATYFAFAYLFAAVILSLLSPALLRAMAPSSYAAAAQVVPIVALSYLFYSLSVIFDTVFYAKKRTHIKPVLLAASSLFSLPCYLILIRSHGSLGAATATLLGFLFHAIITAVAANKYLMVPYEIGRLLRLCLAAVSSYILLRAIFPSAAPSTSIISSLLGFVTFPLLTLVFFCWTRREIYAFLSLVKQKLDVLQ